MKKSRDNKEDLKAFQPKSKVVVCYYCSGNGSVITSIPCPNCKGMGIITISTRGL